MRVKIKVKCPDGVIKYKNKKTGVTTVYITSEIRYNKEKKYNVNKRKYVGKMIDDEYIEANDTFFEIYPELYPLENSADKSGALNVGFFIALSKIMDDKKLNLILDKIYADKANLLKDLSMYLIVSEDNVIQHFPDYEYNHPQFNEQSVSDSYISELFKQIPISQHETFLDEWNEIQPHNEKTYISYDSTNSGTAASGIDLAEIGHAKVDNGLPIVNTALAFNQETGTPLFYEDYPGSIIDNTQCSSMVDRAKRYGYNNVGFILDRGYFSKENIKYMDENGYSFIMMAKGNSIFIKDAIIDARKIFDNDSSCFINGKNLYGITFKRKLYSDDIKDRYIHIFWDKKRASDEEFRVLNQLSGCENDLLKMIEMEKIDNSILERCKKYFEVEIDKNKITSYSRNEQKVQNELRKCGCFAIITSDEMTKEEALYNYRHRDGIEKIFEVSKSFLGEDVFRVHTSESLHSKQQVVFIAEILRAELFNKLSSIREKDKKNYTVPAVIRELEKIEVIKSDNNSYRVRFALTKKQKEILECLGIDEKYLKDEAIKICQKYS